MAMADTRITSISEVAAPRPKDLTFPTGPGAGHDPDPQHPTRRKRWHVVIALLLSLLLHLLLFSLPLGGDGRGPAGLIFPWQDRRVEAPSLRVALVSPRLAPAPSVIDTVVAPSPSAWADVPTADLPLVASAQQRPPLNPVGAEPTPPTSNVVKAEPLPPQSTVSTLSTPSPAEPTPSPWPVVPAAPVMPIAVPAVVPSASSPERVPVSPRDVGDDAREAQRQALATQQEAARVETARVESERQGQVVRQAAVEREALREAQRQETARQDAARVEAARLDAERQAHAARQAAQQAAAQLLASQQEAARQELARTEAARLAAQRQEAQHQELQRQEAARAASAALAVAQRQEVARLDAVRLDAERQEAARQAAAQQEAARMEAERQARARREAVLRAIGRQLDEEAAQREVASNAVRPPNALPLSLSTARRGRLWGRTDANAELILYAEAWARKIQLNTPVDTVRDLAKRPHMTPMVTVAIRSDGSVESVTFAVSSGVPDIDEAVRRIIDAQKPYPAFPPALAREFDVIELRRTWTFDSAVRLY